MKIYTKTGDKGTSQLYSGERRSKDDDVFNALGATDELNASIGVAREYCVMADNGLADQLEEIQSRLFDLGAAIATPPTAADRKKARTQFEEEHITKLEEWIDTWDEQLAPLTNFILPSGGLSATHLHVARGVCRRAERTVIPLFAAEQVAPEVARFLNRLSDYLFVAARTASRVEDKPEVIWKKSAVHKKDD